MAHIAIAVEDIEKAKGFFELLTGSKSSQFQFVETQKVKTSFLKIGDTSLEFLEPTRPDSAISKFLDKRGGGIHHICIKTSHFQNLLHKIKETGVRTLSEPFIGAKGNRVIFFHPKDTFNVLVELEERE